MEKISFMRRLSSSLIDKVLILVLFIISALCISPYGMPSHLGSYYALLDAAPSSYPSQDTYKAMHSVYGNTIYESTEKWVSHFLISSCLYDNIIVANRLSLKK